MGDPVRPALPSGINFERLCFGRLFTEYTDKKKRDLR
jgi:hypothetical protein